MESSNVNDHKSRNKIIKIYFLAIIYIFGSCIQWVLVNSFEYFEFLLSPWLLTAAFITCILIISIQIVISCANKTLPEPLECIFGILIAEIMAIVLSPIIENVDHIVLYIALPVIIFCMVILTTCGIRIDDQNIQIFAALISFCNMLLLFLVLVLLVAWKFFMNIYAIAFFVVLGMAIPILFLNTIYVSMLIAYDHYEPKNLTECLKPALYIYGVFVALVWFFLETEILLG